MIMIFEITWYIKKYIDAIFEYWNSMIWKGIENRFFISFLDIFQDDVILALLIL